MKKQVLLLAFTTILVAGSCMANPVDSQTAKSVAQNFYRSVSGLQTFSIDLAYTEKLPGSDSAVYYICNVNDKDGFVIVSADDAARPILGYSLSGHYSPLRTSAEYSFWMQKNARQLTSMMRNKRSGGAKIKAQWQTFLSGASAGLPSSSARQKSVQAAYPNGVAPLLSTLWNQNPYYNALCPGGSLTGCVATTQAQLMKYWSYPAKGYGNYTYSDPPYGNLSCNFDTVFNWSNMPQSVNDSNADVAFLMYACGVSVNMQYSPSSSSANSPNMVTFFGYNPNTEQVYYRTSTSDATWMAALVNDLNNKRPVCYEGIGGGGGHCWVCDGYDQFENFHMNWGWSGYMDGYFATQLDSSDFLNTSFNEDQYLITGIEPPSGAQFTGYPLVACGSSSVKFTASALTFRDTINSVTWLFPGGNPGSSHSLNPSVTYSTPGSYDVTAIINGTTGIDTIVKSAYISVLPANQGSSGINEGFQEASFPPAGWYLNNPANYFSTWQSSVTDGVVGGYGGSSQCMVFNNCDPDVDPQGERQQIFSPAVDFTGISSPVVYFDVAYAPYNAAQSDTLAVYYSLDCGNTFTQIYMKGGLTLGTAGDSIHGSPVNVNSSNCFIPLPSNWRTDTIHLSALSGQPEVMFSFENRSGYGSTLFIDNVRIPGSVTASVSNVADNRGVSVYPNPSVTGTFHLAFTGSDAQYKTVQVMDMLGNVVFTESINPNTASMDVNLSGCANGIYLVKVNSQNGVFTERLVKN